MNAGRLTGIAVVAMSLLTGFHVAEGPGAAVGGVAGVALHQLGAAVVKAIGAAAAWLEADKEARKDMARALEGVREDLRTLRAFMEGKGRAHDD